MIKKLFSTISAQRQAQNQAELYRSLIRAEAKIGGQLFGPVPTGGRREFFCLDNRTWVWHEEWVDKNGQRQYRTTRYDIRPNGILKAQDGQNYQRLSIEEADRLYEAACLYNQRVTSELYSYA